MRADKEFLSRLSSEEPLTMADALQLDEGLEAQRSLSSLIAKLPEDEPSLAWRSALNEKLAHMAPKPKRTRWTLAFQGLAAATAVAGAFLLFAMVNPAKPNVEPVGAVKGSVTKPGESIEEALISAHEDAGRQAAYGLGWTDDSAKPL
ncbi:MAG: hypothetical protein KIT11_08760 [Fimbriimonadaceae bacterium]|nr:hypothetical protein [Fimbriimonadaceae bacterium]QYK55417.1 MAG: hypothetical protein KF733_10430 [Fimbriimonadaceae bacterium]